MSYFNKRKSSGIFIPSRNGFIEHTGEVGNGSINSLTKVFGYHPDQLYSIHCSGAGKPKIWAIEIEVFTRNIAFVMVDSSVTYLSQKDVNKHLKEFSVVKEFNALTTHDILANAVENGSFSTEFLAKVLNLKDISSNGMFYSEKIKTYLYFTDGILSNFQVDDGLMPYSRHLQEVNNKVFGWISDLAYKYWPNDDFKAKREINIQSDAWSQVPEAFGNKFIALHRTENGGVNLHMLLVCHYNYPINLTQFEEVNHGRYKIENGDLISDPIIIFMGNFKYYFDRSTEMLLYTDQI